MLSRSDNMLGKVRELCPERERTEAVTLADRGAICCSVWSTPHWKAMSTQPLEWKCGVCDHSWFIPETQSGNLHFSTSTSGRYRGASLNLCYKEGSQAKMLHKGCSLKSDLKSDVTGWNRRHKALGKGTHNKCVTMECSTRHRTHRWLLLLAWCILIKEAVLIICNYTKWLNETNQYCLIYQDTTTWCFFAYCSVLLLPLWGRCKVILGQAYQLTLVQYFMRVLRQTGLEY